jgi:hypothetical protein
MAGINYLVNRINTYQILAYSKKKVLQTEEYIIKAKNYHHIKILDLIQRAPQHQQSYPEQTTQN